MHRREDALARELEWLLEFVPATRRAAISAGPTLLPKEVQDRAAKHLLDKN